MSPAPKVSIVVPAHDAATTLAAQLDAIAAGLPAAPPTEILVVDNRSTDDTAATAEAWATSTGAPVASSTRVRGPASPTPATSVWPLLGAS